MKQAILYYFHDPMCSWCYGFNDTLKNLHQNLDQRVVIKKVLGGLAPDTDELMPAAMREQIRGNWQRIEETIPGVIFNYSFWDECQPRRLTYAACRAVIAARQQGHQYEDLMTHAIQKAYYQQARNPSDDDMLVTLAGELKLDEKQFKDNFFSQQTQVTLQQEIDFTRNMFVESFPSLVLDIEGQSFSLKIDYNDYQAILDQVKEKMDALY